MTLTPEIWKLLSDTIASTPGYPSWLKEQGSLDWKSVTRLPIVDVTKDGENARPSVRQSQLQEDYLDFLREQIKLDERGSEWTNILKNRLAALEPFVGKQLIDAMFHFKPHFVILKFCGDTKELIHSEID